MPAVVVLGSANVVPPLMAALHTSGVAATWAVNVRQASQLLDVLPGSPVIVTDDSADSVADHAELAEAHVIDVRGVASSTDPIWAATVAPLIASALPALPAVPARAGPSQKGDPSVADCVPDRVCGLVVDEDRWCVRYRGRPLRLTDAQYRLLARLVLSENRLVHLQELAHDMFDSSHCERQRIHAHVKRLRVRLAQETDGRFSIIAVRGAGYRLSDNSEQTSRSAGSGDPLTDGAPS